MTLRKALAVLVVVVLLVTAVQPARAEAVEPTTVLLIAGAAVVVVVLIVYLVIANTREYQRTHPSALAPPLAPVPAYAEGPTLVLASGPPTVQSP